MILMKMNLDFGIKFVCFSLVAFLFLWLVIELEPFFIYIRWMRITFTLLHVCNFFLGYTYLPLISEVASVYNTLILSPIMVVPCLLSLFYALCMLLGCMLLIFKGTMDSYYTGVTGEELHKGCIACTI